MCISFSAFWSSGVCPGIMKVNRRRVKNGISKVGKNYKKIENSNFGGKFLDLNSLYFRLAFQC